MDITKICRLCTSSLQGNGVDLFTDTKNHLERIKILIRLELFGDGNVPKKMCNNCSFELDNIDRFQERCVQAQKSIEKLISKPHYKILSDKEQLQVSKEKESNCGGTTNLENLNSNNQFQQTLVNSNYHILQNGSVLINGQAITNPNSVINIPFQNIALNGITNQSFAMNNQTGAQIQSNILNLNNQMENVSVSDKALDQSNSLGEQNVKLNPKKEEIKSDEECEEVSDDDCEVVSDDEDVDSKKNLTELKREETAKPVTVDLVKKVKKERLDVCEEMSCSNNQKVVETGRDILNAQEELIVGSQMDDLIIKAVRNNVKEQSLEKMQNLVHSISDLNQVDNNLSSDPTKIITLEELLHVQKEGTVHYNKTNIGSSIVGNSLICRPPPRMFPIAGPCRRGGYKPNSTGRSSFPTPNNRLTVKKILEEKNTQRIIQNRNYADCTGNNIGFMPPHSSSVRPAYNSQGPYKINEGTPSYNFKGANPVKNKSLKFTPYDFCKVRKQTQNSQRCCYQCLICDKCFESYQIFVKHVKTHNTNT